MNQSTQQAPIPPGQQYQGLLIHLTEMPWGLTRATSRQTYPSARLTQSSSDSNLKQSVRGQSAVSTVTHSWILQNLSLDHTIP